MQWTIIYIHEQTLTLSSNTSSKIIKDYWKISVDHFVDVFTGGVQNPGARVRGWKNAPRSGWVRLGFKKLFRSSDLPWEFFTILLMNFWQCDFYCYDLLSICACYWFNFPTKQLLRIARFPRRCRVQHEQGCFGPADPDLRPRGCVERRARQFRQSGSHRDGHSQERWNDWTTVRVIIFLIWYFYIHKGHSLDTS
jgi:hypothetical protein